MTRQIRVVLVKHLLNPEGMKFVNLPALANDGVVIPSLDTNAKIDESMHKIGWAKTVRGLISRHQSSVTEEERGFISIDFKQGTHDPALLKIDLRFKDETTLNKWLNYPPHQILINALDKYRTKAWQWAAFNIDQGKEIDYANVAWQTVQLEKDVSKGEKPKGDGYEPATCSK